MSSEGVWSRQTFCPARVNQGKFPVNGSPAKSLILVRLFIVKCPAIIQNVRQRTGSSLDKISDKAKMNFAYSGDRDQSLLYPLLCLSKK